MLPYCFNLATYSKHRLFIPSLRNPSPIKEDTRRLFACPLYFTKDSSLELPEWGEENRSEQELRLRINAISDWMCARVLHSAKPKMLLWALTDLMMKKVKSSKQVGRVLLCFTVLFRRLKRKVARFLSGTLFVIGGYLRNEAKSYLEATSTPTVVEKGEHVREL